jgi:DNA primase
MPKYYLQQQKDFVFNLDAQKTHDTIIVTEGQLDAIQVGGVALAGNSPSNNQCTIIEELEKDVVLLPDFDAAGMDTINTAIRRGWSVAFPEWEDDIKDANDAVMRYGRLFTVQSILNSVETSGTKIKILAKTRCR